MRLTETNPVKLWVSQDAASAGPACSPTLRDLIGDLTCNYLESERRKGWNGHFGPSSAYVGLPPRGIHELADGSTIAVD